MKQDPGTVVIVGEALVDIFENEIVVGGAPFNVARHLAGFGLHPLMVTRIGKDEHGARILAEFNRFGLSTKGVQFDVRHPTGHVLVRMTEHGHHFDIPSNQAFDRIDTEEALALLGELGVVRHVYCGSLIRRSEASDAALGAILRARRAPAFLDLNLRPAAGRLPSVGQIIAHTEVLKVNDAELQVLLDWHNRGPSISVKPSAIAALRDPVASLMQEFRIGQMIVTFGGEGAAVFDAHGACLAREPGINGVNVVDTVGAGDAFSSVMLAGSLLGWPLAKSLSRANAFAAAICAIRGAVPASIDFYDCWIDEWFT